MVPLASIELVGGPGDGGIHDVPDGTKIWVLRIVTTIQTKRSAEVAEEHAYTYTSRLAASGAQVFRYAGERVRS